MLYSTTCGSILEGDSPMATYHGPCGNLSDTRPNIERSGQDGQKRTRDPWGLV